VPTSAPGPTPSAEDSTPGWTDDLATAALALARLFAHGATLWTWAPGAPQHAQHLAVEFVHPVVVGSRALPAVAVVEDDATPALRSMAKAGDILAVVADAGAPVTDVLRRAEAWGLTTVWLGTGPRPSRSPAHHLVWVGDEPMATHDGGLVLGYHLLWELTHVCFEHPGLLEEVAEEGTVCITCADEGRLGEVVRSEGDEATVRTATGVETVSTMMVAPVVAGDLVLVHAGTAISVVDP